nr:MAG TPA: hypothetical protein [Caudoviricetes sp.]
MTVIFKSGRILFTFSIIPYLILFVKHCFCNQHPNCNASRKRA